MTQKQLPLKHPKWVRDLERAQRPESWRGNKFDLGCRLSRARLVYLRARDTRWHWVALSFVSVLVMVEL